MSGCLTLLAVLGLIVIYRKASVKRRPGSDDDGWRTPPRIRRSTSYAARQGRDFAHGGHRRTDWHDDSWGW